VTLKRTISRGRGILRGQLGTQATFGKKRRKNRGGVRLQGVRQKNSYEEETPNEGIRIAKRSPQSFGEKSY